MTADPSLRRKTIALVGLMGVGKSSIGRRLAAALGLPFRDADSEVEARGPVDLRHLRNHGRSGLPRRRAAGHRPADGRRPTCAGDRRRRLHQRRDPGADQGPGDLDLAESDLPLLARRIGRKDTRPLVRGKDPLEVLTGLAAVRNPIYAQADIAVETSDTPHTEAVEAVLRALTDYIAGAPS